jgi:hypothetical protein
MSAAKTKRADKISGSQFSSFYLPYIYGIATANFIALIQLIPLPQLQFDWNMTKPESLTYFTAFWGFLGVLSMSASIPIAIAFALYCEIAIKHKSAVSFFDGLMVAVIFGIGTAGLACTFASINRVAGHTFFSATVLSALVMFIASRRTLRNSN